MTTYLHILNHAGATQAVLNTRQHITPETQASLVSSLQNPTFTQEVISYKAYMASSGTPDKFTTRGHPEEFQGVGILSSHSNLNKLPRFTDSGQIKKEDIPIQIRGKELFAYLEKMVKKVKPPTRTGNLTPWTQATRPSKISSVTPEQLSQAVTLKGQGVSHRKIAGMTAIPYGSLSKLLIPADAHL